MDATRVGTLAELTGAGRLVTKVGGRPVLVVAHEGDVYAIDNRCPHLGFPLHQGSVEAGLITCHWHHARFDLASGCTLDPWADDADGYDVEIRNGDVWVASRPVGDRLGHLTHRLRQGLEDGLTLVIAKSALGLLEAGVSPAEIVGEGARFGVAGRRDGWGAGLTVLVAMANVAPHLHPADRPVALVHGLAFVARDVAGEPPRYPLPPLEGSTAPSSRLATWYRRFVESRNGDGAERALTTLLARGELDAAERVMFAAASDHVFIDEGHALDFTNKAFEALGHLGDDAAGALLPALVAQTAAARRSEEELAWRHPVDLVALAGAAASRLDAAHAAGRQREPWVDADVARLAERILGDDPADVADAVPDALAGGATLEQAARAVAFAAALRLVRFHTNNDHADWNEIHHAFTTANAVHQAITRRTRFDADVARAVIHGALRVHLDRFLNVPAARPPRAEAGSLADLTACWDVQGAVDQAGAAAYGFLAGGGAEADLIAALGHALVEEDAGFHWYQVFEAAVRQVAQWPAGSEPRRLILAGVARFLAAHTPTRRELPRVVHIAARLRRGDALYEDEG